MSTQQSKTFSKGTKNASPNIASYSPELNQLLEKLRPFQREAFDFATRGVTHSRQWAVTSNNTKARKKDKVTGSVTKNDGIFEYDRDLLGKGRILLADEMGLGKTVTSLAIMTAYMDEWPLLILCPASLRFTWPGEIEKFLPTISPRSIYVVSGFDDADFFANEHKRKRIKIVVATYSLLQTRSAAARVLDQFNFQCVIADESHNLKERNSQRCKLGLPILQKAKRLVLLSGTPALARPVELWAQVSCIAPDLFGTYTAYTKRYCNARRGRFGWDVTGLSNADELHAKLRQIMVRRLKSNVLSELPPKQRSIVPIKMDPDRIKASRDLMEELKQTRSSVSELVGSEAQGADFEARRLLMMAYQASGIGKARGVADFLLDWLAGSGTQKILVFAHHREVLDILEMAVSKKYKGVGHIRIDGTVPPGERALRVRKFQTNSRVRVGILSMTAAGVGLTLTAASSVIFAELHWTPGVLAQAEDRCHRIGQKNAVNVMYCVVKDQELSVDLRLWAMLSRKVGNLGKVIDGCKGASMNAREASSFQSTQDTSTSGESVGDELTRFFAETSPLERSSVQPKEPVKGSILSFFKKNDTRSEPSMNEVSSSEKPCSHAEKSHPKPTPPQLQCRKTPNSTFKSSTWCCETCTFLNSKQRPKSGWLSCEMCGSPHVDEGQLVPVEDEVCVVSPSSANKNEANGKARTSDIIVIDDDAKPKTKKESDIIEIDMVSPSKPQKLGRNHVASTSLGESERKRKGTSCLLNFCVSKNSERISIHSADTGEPFHINFDIGQVVTEATADCLLDAQIKRMPWKNNGMNTSLPSIQFDDVAVNRVSRSVGRLTKDMPNPANALEQCSIEVKEFVSSYLSLREVEKKALKEWDEPVQPFCLRQTLANIMTSSVTNTCTDRYTGGAKELALQNLENGKATSSDKSVLNGEACAWCAGRLSDASIAKGVDATYCSQTCAEQGRLRRGGMFASTRVRAQVFRLEGGVCRQCGVDAHALYLRICSLAPAERLNALCNANWQLPKSGPALERLLSSKPKEGDFWQADHIVAVAEGGGGCGLDNLRTLCTPCHKVETEKLRSNLRLHGGVQQDDNGKRKQMDIRSAFFSSKNTQARKRLRDEE